MEIEAARPLIEVHPQDDVQPTPEIVTEELRQVRDWPTAAGEYAEGSGT